jgi:hypothetical protein
VIQRKTVAVLAEHRRLRHLNSCLTAEQAAAFVSALSAAAKEVVQVRDDALYRLLMRRTCQLLPGTTPDLDRPHPVVIPAAPPVGGPDAGDEEDGPGSSTPSPDGSGGAGT